MTSILTPQVLLLAYWLVIVGLAAFFLRLACSLCTGTVPSWRRAIVSVVLVTSAAYLTFDFTCYLLLRCMQDVIIPVPPGYGYNQWFHEPIGFKWAVASQAGPLRWLAPTFALCVAGILQVIVLQAEVTFRWALSIFLLQTAATAFAGFLLGMLMGVALDTLGMSAPQASLGPVQAQGQPDPRQQGGPKAGPGEKGDAVTAHAEDVLRNLKNYANSHLDEFKQEVAPVTRHLPQPVQDFLDGGGWWIVLGLAAIVALLWLRSMVNRVRGAVSAGRVARRRAKKPKARTVGPKLKIKLAKIGEALTEEGPTRIIVKGEPARLRVVVLSLGARNAGELTEEMADRVLDWIKPGLAELAALDFPAVRVWPPFFSTAGFATAAAANLVFPEPVGALSNWDVLVGRVKMGQAVINVALALYADEPNGLRVINIADDQWLGVLGIKGPRKRVAAR